MQEKSRSFVRCGTMELHWRGSEMEGHQFFFSRRFVELEALSKVREVPPGGVAAFSGVLTVEQTKTENQHKKIEF